VEPELHILSISAPVGEQWSFHVPGNRTVCKRNTVPMFGALAVYSADLSSYREIIGGGLRTGEACSAADIILNIGHDLQQTW
jgi:hypothetical protein